jgi:hypothetical protein
MNAFRKTRGLIRPAITVVALAAVGMFVGCESDAQTGGLIGAGAGAGLGAIIGHQSGNAGAGAAIGAGAGAITGYIIGNESDKNKARERAGDY